MFSDHDRNLTNEEINTIILTKQDIFREIFFDCDTPHTFVTRTKRLWATPEGTQLNDRWCEFYARQIFQQLLAARWG